MVVPFRNKKVTTKEIEEASEVIENIDEEAMERNRMRLAETLTGIKLEGNIDISLTEEYDLAEQHKLNQAFDVTMKALNENPEWFLDD